MTDYLVLTVIADDREGIVEQISQTIIEHGGNWMESSMARLAGKFAGILMVEVEPAKHADLEQALSSLSAHGIKIIVEQSAPSQEKDAQVSCIEIVANDRPGIVGEISALLASNNVSLMSLETFCESTPMSAGMMFYAHTYLQLPEGMTADQLTDILESLSDDLMVEIVDA